MRTKPKYKQLKLFEDGTNATTQNSNAINATNLLVRKTQPGNIPASSKRNYKTIKRN